MCVAHRRASAHQLLARAACAWVLALALVLGGEMPTARTGGETPHRVPPTARIVSETPVANAESVSAPTQDTAALTLYDRVVGFVDSNQVEVAAIAAALIAVIAIVLSLVLRSDTRRQMRELQRSPPNGQAPDAGPGLLSQLRRHGQGIAQLKQRVDEIASAVERRQNTDPPKLDDGLQRKLEGLDKRTEKLATGLKAVSASLDAVRESGTGAWEPDEAFVEGLLSVLADRFNESEDFISRIEAAVAKDDDLVQRVTGGLMTRLSRNDALAPRLKALVAEQVTEVVREEVAAAVLTAKAGADKALLEVVQYNHLRTATAQRKQEFVHARAGVRASARREGYTPVLQQKDDGELLVIEAPAAPDQVFVFPDFDTQPLDATLVFNLAGTPSEQWQVVRPAVCSQRSPGEWVLVQWGQIDFA